MNNHCYILCLFSQSIFLVFVVKVLFCVLSASVVIWTFWILFFRWNPDGIRGSKSSSWSWRKRKVSTSCWSCTAGLFRWLYWSVQVKLNWICNHADNAGRSHQVLTFLCCISVQVPDLLHVAAALKEHTAHVGNLYPTPTSSVSPSIKTKRQQISEIWTSIYNAACSTQACINVALLSSIYYNILNVTIVLLGNTSVVQIQRQRRSG